ncbi:MAG TPA: RtcB family protein [Bacillota bacterium]
MSGAWEGPLERVDDLRWRIPKEYDPGMRVDGLVFADQRLVQDIRGDQALQQVANVAHLPGILGHSLAMPDIHWGYGFPVGGVAAVDPEDGAVSPGGIGFDCNCGVRLLASDLTEDEVRPRLDRLMDRLADAVPTGVGARSRLRLDAADLDRVLAGGMAWAVEAGFGWSEDLERAEEGGRMAGADPAQVSPRARERGRDQLGTLGSGNHFIEVAVVRRIDDPDLAEAFGLRAGHVTVMIHSGSRGFGHQVATDYVRLADAECRRLGIRLPDRQLACAPVRSQVGQDYLAALAAASNFAWANRQCMTHWVREAFADIFGLPAKDLGMELVYDHAHNIAKLERARIDGRQRRVLVHRKGACRAFPAGHDQLPPRFRPYGQPVFVPGDMGRASYVLVGTERALEETFGSICHGAGRRLSRSAARRQVQAGQLRRSLSERGIVVRGVGDAALAEEAPEAYKDVSQVVDVVERAGLARKVARLEPLGVLKG